MIKSHTLHSRHVPMIIGWLVTLTVCVFYMYEYFLRVAPASMIEYFIAVFNIQTTELGLIDSSYYWAYTPLQIIAGSLVDHYGVRNLLLMALLSCIIGSIFFSLDSHIMWPFIGRFLIGFGSAFGFVAVLKTASQWLPKKQFPLAVGIATGMGMFGAISSEIVMTHMVREVGVSATMNYSVVFALALTVTTFYIVHDRPFKRRRSHGNKRIRMIRKTFTTVISNPQMWLIGFIGMALYLPTMLFSGLWGIPYFMHIRQAPPELAAHMSTMIFWGWLIGSPLLGFISSYIAERRMIITTGCFFSTIIISLLIYLPITNIPTIIILMFALGVFSSSQILVFDIASSINKRSHIGTAIAITNMFVMLGGFFQPFVGHILQTTAVSSDVVFTEPGFQKALMIMPILSALACLISFCIHEKPHANK